MRLLGVALVCWQLASAQPAAVPTAARSLGTVVKGGPDGAIHVVAFGDWGYRGSHSGRQSVAAAIEHIQAEAPFDLGLTLGDNFYPAGVKSVDDPLWQELWENGYGKLGIPFFATLGNHDYMGNQQAQVDYTNQSRTWRMPFRYYSFVAGPVQFFALDTDEDTNGHFTRRKPWSDAQSKWLDEELARSQSAWKVVYGHHPVYSDGFHGDEARLKARLLPILKARHVDLYLCGHEHDLEFHDTDGLQFVVVGGGGQQIRQVTRKRAQFAQGTHGFLDLSATITRLAWIIRGSDGKPLCSSSVSRLTVPATEPVRTRTAPSSQPH